MKYLTQQLALPFGNGLLLWMVSDLRNFHDQTQPPKLGVVLEDPGENRSKMIGEI